MLFSEGGVVSDTGSVVGARGMLQSDLSRRSENKYICTCYKTLQIDYCNNVKIP